MKKVERVHEPGKERVAVVGAGLMGHGIAQVFALGGHQVWLHDSDEGRLEKALAGIRGNLDLLVQGGVVDAARVAPCLGRIQTTPSLAQAAGHADLVVEAVYEDLAVKRSVFAALAAVCPPHTIFASNTSGLSVNRLAEGCAYAERMVVAHFWNPPHIFSIVEVVPGKRTSPATVEGLCAALKGCGKRPVVLKQNIPGHIGNRLQFALFREALSLVQRGVASAEDVDAVVELTFGRRLPVTGPLKSADLGGLDLFYSIASYLFKDLDNSKEPPPLLADAIEAGHLGAKTGEGLMEWPEGSAADLKRRRDASLIRWLKETGE